MVFYSAERKIQHAQVWRRLGGSSLTNRDELRDSGGAPFTQPNGESDGGELGESSADGFTSDHE